MVKMHGPGTSINDASELLFGSSSPARFAALRTLQCHRLMTHARCVRYLAAVVIFSTTLSPAPPIPYPPTRVFGGGRPFPLHSLPRDVGYLACLPPVCLFPTASRNLVSNYSLVRVKRNGVLDRRFRVSPSLVASLFPTFDSRRILFLFSTFSQLSFYNIRLRSSAVARNALWARSHVFFFSDFSLEQHSLTYDFCFTFRNDRQTTRATLAFAKCSPLAQLLVYHQISRPSKAIAAKYSN